MKISTVLYCSASLFALVVAQPTALATATKPDDQVVKASIAADSESPLRFVPGLEEPLVPTGPTSESEDEALDKAIARYRTPATTSADFAQRAIPFEDFLHSYPASRWSMAIDTNMGIGYYHAGYFSRALSSWENAWKAGRSATGTKAKALTDRAIGEVVRMHARVGHATELERVFADVGDRPITGSATEMFTGAREGLWLFKHEPGKSYRCGSMALKNLLISLNADASAIRVAEGAESGPHGFSLDQVGDLATQAGFAHRLVFRERGQPIPVPSVINWKMNHYAAIVGEEHGTYHIKDPTFGGGDLWVSKAAVDSESTGYFLIPAQQLRASTWRGVNTKEAKGVFGMGSTNEDQKGSGLPDDKRLNGGNGPPNGNPASGNGNGNPNGNGNGNPSLPTNKGCGGMCQVDALLMTVGLNITDQPVGYAPQKGPPVFIRLSYNQREDSQPGIFSSFNVSPKWTLNVLSYVQDDPNSFPGQSVTRYAPGGGLVDYTYGYSYDRFSGQYSPDRQGQAILTRIPADNGPANSYELRQADGSKLVYDLSDGSTGPSRRIFMTQIVDQAGNALTLHYDNTFRLMRITDATNRDTVFTYGATDPLLVTRVTDPFGRHADLAYNSSGHLSAITDVVGMTSSMNYDSSGLIYLLTTPYGISSFIYGDGQNLSRFLEITDPLGYTQRVEFAHGAPGIPSSEPVVPAIGSENNYIDLRNTFVWDKHLYPLTHSDYTQAQIYHWLHNPNNQTSPILESTKSPLENRVWNIYPNQSGSDTVHEGSEGTPIAIGRVLDDGTTQAIHYTYNPFGKKLTINDQLGRETLYTYDNSNEVDLLTVQQKTSATQKLIVASFSYNGQHLPLTSTDASGATTNYSYNTAGQLTSVTNALNQTTQYDYDSLGRLVTITNANGAVQWRLAYDSSDRVLTRTDSEGYVLKYAYDNLDRLTKITYPDGTSTSYVYDRLDLGSVTDRLGRTTTYAHDGNRNLTSVTDPQNQITQYAYYENGVLQSLTDPKGNVTSWNIDIQSRPTLKTYPDGKTETSTYENTTSRLKSRKDALNQVKTYAYFSDDRLSTIQYTGTVNPTPNVAFTYDSYFPRLTGFTDGIGITSITYQPIGTAGALQLASETGPYAANDTVSYAYDVLGRVKSRTVDSATDNYGYDAIGRMISHVDALGTFNYGYLGQTEQAISMSSASGISTSYAYDTNANDRRLSSISHNSSATGFHLGFGFTSTPEDRIKTISKNETVMSGAPPRQPSAWTYGYDDDDRLLTASVLDITSGNYTYTYDINGNINNFSSPAGSTAATYNNRNQLTAFGSKTYNYDATGNLLSDGIRNYLWDAENRLISATLIGDAASLVTFKYDGLGRRLSVATERIFGSGFENVSRIASGSAASRYLWCGGEICQGRSSADIVTRRYFTEGESHIDSGKGLVYAKDQLGSVRATINVSTGGRVDSFDYDPYGNLTSTTTPIDAPDKLYAGMFYSSSGLYLTLYRAYDPSVGRWISEDPIGLRGGINRYAYVKENPVNLLDPFGLRALDDCEKNVLAPYIPKIDLDNADIHDGEVPLILAFDSDKDGITLGNDIYFRSGAYEKGTPTGFQILSHELVHVGQYRDGMTYASYSLSYLTDGGYSPDNEYEKPAYDMGNKVLKDLTASGVNCTCGDEK